MNQKIEWYREVLEIEPNSKVFFPLAKLLVATESIEDATLILQQGLMNHPEYIEARLLLVELYARQQCTERLSKEISILAELFKKYPIFLSEWSNELSANPAMQDAALALSFFAAALSGKKITWTNVIFHGLSKILSSDASSFDQPQEPFQPFTHSSQASGLQHPAFDGGTQAASPFSYPEPPFDPCPTHEVNAAASTQISAQEFPLQPDSTQLHASDESFPAIDSQMQPPAERDADKGEIPVAQERNAESILPSTANIVAMDSEEEPEEPFSLRTRSMAEILAEQGDTAGAIEIYRELVQAAPSSEKNFLQARLDELTKNSSSQASHHPDHGAANAENNRLVSLLESLASRLEDRAR